MPPTLTQSLTGTLLECISKPVRALCYEDFDLEGVGGFKDFGLEGVGLRGFWPGGHGASRILAWRALGFEDFGLEGAGLRGF